MQTTPQPHQGWKRSRKLVLHGYLTPSLNQLLRKHWSVIQKAKAEAQEALDYALATQKAQ